MIASYIIIRGIIIGIEPAPLVGTSLLCFYFFIFYLLCYAAVLINFTYYAQYYAHVSDLCLGINLFVLKIRLFY